MTNLTDNQRRWARTLLIVYPRRKKILEALSETRMKIALGGFSEPGTEELFGKVIELNYRMQGIHNLYALVKSTLEKLPMRHSELLTMRHVAGKGVAELADHVETSVRNVYRRYDRALEAFYGALKKDGHGEEWLTAEYGEDPLIMGIFRRADGKTLSTRRKPKRQSEPLHAPVISRALESEGKTA